jgi:Toprim-like/CHC2 zinc finger
MTIKQAKDLPLSSFFDKLGCVPDLSKKHGYDIWYKSPLRPDEKTASLHINTRKNIWFDFGLSKGGNIIDFVVALKNCDAETALKFIEQINQTPSKNVLEAPKTFSDNIVATTKNEAFKLDEIRRDFAPSLIDYIKNKRKINATALSEFAVEIHFSDQKGRKFFGVGMKNLSDGYEIRNPYFKGSIGKKDLIFVKGTAQNGLSIFEGMFDFFSAITYFGKNVVMQNDILILNSVAFEAQAIDFLKNHPEYTHLSLFLDNDAAGQLTVEHIKTAFPERLIEPSFALYLSHKDFNDFLIARAKKSR